jgi:hypothetical protein
MTRLESGSLLLIILSSFSIVLPCHLFYLFIFLVVGIEPKASCVLYHLSPVLWAAFQGRVSAFSRLASDSSCLCFLSSQDYNYAPCLTLCPVYITLWLILNNAFRSLWELVILTIYRGKVANLLWFLVIILVFY